MSVTSDATTTTSAVVQERLEEPLPAQARRLLPTVAFVVVGVGLLSVAVAAFGRLKGIELPDLTRDPSAVTHTHFWVGAMSFLGFAAWGLAAGATLAAGFTLTPRSPRRRMLLQVSAISAYLLLDDMLLFHEEVLPNLGVPEKIIYPAYFVVTLLWVWFNRAEIKRTEWLLLVVAFLFFAASIGLDEIAPDISTWTYVEDVLKFGGIVMWSVYLVRTSIRSMWDVRAASVTAPSTHSA